MNAIGHPFIATTDAVHCYGTTSVFIDTDRHGLNIDGAMIEPATAPETNLIMHRLGMPSDQELIVEITKRHSLSTVEDAACTIANYALKERSTRRQRPAFISAVAAVVRGCAPRRP